MKQHSVVICLERIGCGTVPLETHELMTSSLARILEQNDILVFESIDSDEAVVIARKQGSRTVIFVTVEARESAYCVAQSHPDLTVVLLAGVSMSMEKPLLNNMKIVPKGTLKMWPLLSSIIKRD